MLHQTYRMRHVDWFSQIFIDLLKVRPCYAPTNPVSFWFSRSVFVCLVFLLDLASQYVGAQRLRGGGSGRRFAPPSGRGSASPL